MCECSFTEDISSVIEKAALNGEMDLDSEMKIYESKYFSEEDHEYYKFLDDMYGSDEELDSTLSLA